MEKEANIFDKFMIILLLLINFSICVVRRLVEVGAYFKVREINNINCQNLVIFFLKIRTKH